jgi:hypothetical protein
MERLLRDNPKIDLLATLAIRNGHHAERLSIHRVRPEQITALDVFLGEHDWRSWPRDRTDADFTARVLNRWIEKLGALGFQGSRQITVEANRTPLYRLALFSRHPKADEFWQKIITVSESGQRELL